ncbi:DUF6882 domain-containing protein [Hymenobacter swuensis]|uniref:Uncharacterized protein n=1 Tax=Hymenobacter swuensis DY53 TaxID=1227739 RepID=W8F754_9BACT|nr:DUF6882 domain-containing protein [Hymenobacter swuensis]AHJ97555.1 hypothetical protein Hsw_1960 [Hymenobacter swuensis DY53]
MSQINYPKFANECLQELIEKQDVFNVEYDIDGYENWFYNDATGLLTFSTGEEEVNFKYLRVGSLSKNSNTWKWSWDNDMISPDAKEKLNCVREFGEKYDFDKLTDGYFESSEEEAWELSAITAKLTDGIGVYRPVSEHLLVFIVVKEFVDTESAQLIKERYIECDVHDYRRIAFVCKHLNHTSKVGFEESFETHENMELEEEEDFQAWCDECEKVRQKEGGWNDKSMVFANIKLVCEQCYFEMKELNLGYK